MVKFTELMHAGLIVATMVLLSSCGESEEEAIPPAPLTVGGMISGLSGTGLGLQLNGANNLAVNANGKFNFPMPIEAGSAYAITVLTSPSIPIRQTCTISQGNGTIVDTPVNNVAVNCITNSYAVGGTVSGLSGKGLTLQLNGTNDVAIEKNGNFIFPGIRLPDGGDYSVAIKTVPVRQMCTIEPVSTAPDNDTINIVSVTCNKKTRR